MYSVVLADDEHWILESLKGTVDWNNLGYEIVGEARNGIDAFDLIDKLRPDAAFIDIRMPGMNGLDLIQKLYEIDSDVKCVVASGYAEFEYAKQAMQHGVTEYCLKPFDKDDITAVLTRTKERIERDKQSLRNELLVLLQEREEAPEADIVRLLERVRFPWSREDGAFVIVIRGNSNGLPAWFKRLALRIGGSKTAYLLQGSDREEAVRVMRNIAVQADGVGISMVFTTTDRMRERIEEAVIASYNRFTAEEAVGDVKVTTLLSDEMKPSVTQMLKEGLQRCDMRFIREGLQAAAAEFRSGNSDIRHAYLLYNNLMSSIYKNESQERYAVGYDELASRFDSVYTMLDHLRVCIADSFNESEQGVREKRGEDVLPQIVQYIRDHFQETLTIQEISKMFFLHPNYLSQLFKKELNVNFTKYVSDIRMEYASSLLNSTSFSIGEVAEKSGYNDYFYFARTFKKHMGLTPTEYRSR